MVIVTLHKTKSLITEAVKGDVCTRTSREVANADQEVQVLAQQRDA